MPDTMIQKQFGERTYMLYRKHFQLSGKIIIYVMLTVGMLTACGQKQDETMIGVDGAHEDNIVSGKDALDAANEVAETEEAVNVNEAVEEREPKTAESTESDELKRRFGANCITNQTFEVELSECDGKVWFVPYAPSGEEDFHIQIVQGEEVLDNISAYVPEELEGEEFVSLDAVAFFDVNYDDETDIVLIETYGNTSFAVVYYGEVFTYLDGKESVFFYAMENLSDSLTSSVDGLTISVIRDYLSDGKKNGEFEDYREAYLTIGKLMAMESEGRIQYNLVYFDEDDIPELVADNRGYSMSLYVYHDGRIYTLMDGWGYGAMGNAGYEYCPRKNSLRNYNADYAGLILYTTYCSISADYTMDTVVSIKTVNFDDTNRNGMPDEDEEESFGYYSVDYINNVEIAPEEYESYSMGEYVWLGSEPGGMNLEELIEALY